MQASEEPMNETLGNARQAVGDDDTPFAQMMAQPFTLYVRGMARLQAESIRFGADCVIKALRMPQRFGACRTPSDVLATAGELAVETAREWLDQSQRIVALGAGDFESTTASLI
jgi:hypothetical protein